MGNTQNVLQPRADAPLEQQSADAPLEQPRADALVVPHESSAESTSTVIGGSNNVSEESSLSEGELQRIDADWKSWQFDMRVRMRKKRRGLMNKAGNIFCWQNRRSAGQIFDASFYKPGEDDEVWGTGKKFFSVSWVRKVTIQNKDISELLPNKIHEHAGLHKCAAILKEIRGVDDYTVELVLDEKKGCITRNGEAIARPQANRYLYLDTIRDHGVDVDDETHEWFRPTLLKEFLKYLDTYNNGELKIDRKAREAINKILETERMAQYSGKSKYGRKRKKTGWKKPTSKRYCETETNLKYVKSTAKKFNEFEEVVKKGIHIDRLKKFFAGDFVNSKYSCRMYEHHCKAKDLWGKLYDDYNCLRTSIENWQKLFEKEQTEAMRRKYDCAVSGAITQFLLIVQHTKITLKDVAKLFPKKAAIFAGLEHLEHTDTHKEYTGRIQYGSRSRTLKNIIEDCEKQYKIKLHKFKTEYESSDSVASIWDHQWKDIKKYFEVHGVKEEEELAEEFEKRKLEEAKQRAEEEKQRAADKAERAASRKRLIAKANKFLEDRGVDIKKPRSKEFHKWYESTEIYRDIADGKIFELDQSKGLQHALHKYGETHVYIMTQQNLPQRSKWLLKKFSMQKEILKNWENDGRVESRKNYDMLQTCVQILEEGDATDEARFFLEKRGVDLAKPRSKDFIKWYEEYEKEHEVSFMFAKYPNYYLRALDIYGAHKIFASVNNNEEKSSKAKRMVDTTFRQAKNILKNKAYLLRHPKWRKCIQILKDGDELHVDSDSNSSADSDNICTICCERFVGLAWSCCNQPVCYHCAEKCREKQKISRAEVHGFTGGVSQRHHHGGECPFCREPVDASKPFREIKWECPVESVAGRSDMDQRQHK